MTRPAHTYRWARRSIAVAVALVVTIVSAAGCGYSQSSSAGSDSGYRWRSLYRRDVQTVAVPIFGNIDFHQGVEFSLTKAVVNTLEATTPYKVVSRERADTILEGEIVRVEVSPVSYDRYTGIPQEQLVTIRVNFVWKDLRDGRILAQRRGFEQATTYYPTLGEGQYVGDQKAVEDLARGIVQELQSDW
jgi:hypothetical protein